MNNKFTTLLLRLDEISGLFASFHSTILSACSELNSLDERDGYLDLFLKKSLDDLARLHGPIKQGLSTLSRELDELRGHASFSSQLADSDRTLIADGSEGDLELSRSRCIVRVIGVPRRLAYRAKQSLATPFQNIRCIDLSSSNVQAIPASRFSCLDSLLQVLFPASLHQIGCEAFWHCESLSSIEFPAGLTEISKGAFEYCRSLHDVSLPDGLAVLGGCAFGSCTGLRSLNLPKGLKTFAWEAISGCSALRLLLLACAPETLKRRWFGPRAFRDFVLTSCEIQSVTLIDLVDTFEYHAERLLLGCCSALEE